MLKNGTFASPAIAFASRVLPVPGGPTINTPFGILPPSFWNLGGSLRNSIISCTSSLASSIPATSAKVTFLRSSVSNFALLLPKDNALFPPICVCLIKNIHTPTKSIIGPHKKRNGLYHGGHQGV